MPTPAIDRWLLSTTVLLASIVLSHHAYAQAVVCSETEIQRPVGAPSELFGSSFALDGDILVVGAPSEQVAGQPAGAAHVFERIGDTWVHVQRLVPAQSFVNQAFGRDVEVEGEIILVSAVRTIANPTDADGEVFAFERIGGSWQQVQVLGQGLPDSRFGQDIALSGNFVAATARGSGSVFVSERVSGTWTQTQILDESSIAPLPFPSQTTTFGRWVSLKGNTLAIGHSGPAGVHIFSYDGTAWQFVAELTRSGASFPFTTNTAISACENEVAIGSESSDSGRGEVWFYEKSQGSWAPTQVLTPNDPLMVGDRFGCGVALSGELLGVGRKGDSQGGGLAGALHVFRRSSGNWEDSLKIVGARPEAERQLGAIVQLAGQDIYGSADFASAPYLSVGAVHEYQLGTEVGFSYCVATTNSIGQPALLDAVGRPGTASNCIELRGAEIPTGVFGYFLMSLHQGFLPLFGSSQGNLCLSLPIVRFSDDILVSSTSGEMVFVPDLSKLPQGTTVQPGDTWNFQLWFRDSNPMPTSNTTNGLALTFATGGAPAVQFPATLLELEEDASQFAVAVTLSEAADLDLTVPYTTSGTATYSVDWRVEESNPIVIPAGDTSFEMTIIMSEDSIPEGNETAILELGSPIGGVLGTASEFILTIRDDD